MANANNYINPKLTQLGRPIGPPYDNTISIIGIFPVALTQEGELELIVVAQPYQELEYLIITDHLLPEENWEINEYKRQNGKKNSPQLALYTDGKICIPLRTTLNTMYVPIREIICRYWPTALPPIDKINEAIFNFWSPKIRNPLSGSLTKANTSPQLIDIESAPPQNRPPSPPINPPFFGEPTRTILL